MKNNFDILLQDRITKLSIFSFVGIFIIYLAAIVLSFSRLPPVIPLFNSLPWGNARLAPSFVIFVFPILFFIIFIMNNIVASRMYRNHVLIARILSFNSLLVIFLGLLAYIQILLLIF